MPDDLLFKRCINDLLKLGIDVKGEVIDYFYTREKHAYPIYQLDYKLHLKKLLSSLDGIANIHICGRNGLLDTSLWTGRWRWALKLRKLYRVKE